MFYFYKTLFNDFLNKIKIFRYNNIFRNYHLNFIFYYLKLMSFLFTKLLLKALYSLLKHFNQRRYELIKVNI
jgi:hypothetical protein